MRLHTAFGFGSEQGNIRGCGANGRVRRRSGAHGRSRLVKSCGNGACPDYRLDLLQNPLSNGVATMDNTQTADATLVSQLNDLLQLDHDAVAAYKLAIAELDSPRLKSELQ